MISYSNWAVVSVNFLVVLSLSFAGIALSAILYLVGAKWRFEVRQIAVSLTALFPLAFILLIILLLGADHTFPWIVNITLDEQVHMPGWYTLPLLAVREIVGMIVVMYLSWIFIKRQDLSERSADDALKFHRIACWIPFFYVLYCTMVAWDFEMTLKLSWHSAIYGMQNMVSNFNMFLSFLVIWIYVLNTRGKLVKQVKEHIYNYLAQMMLAFTLLWMYTFFAQYLVIWYGNIGDEVDRVMGMQNGDYTVLWWSMIFLKFVIPFCTLALTKSRHTPSVILAVGVCIITGTLFERYTWISGINGTGTYPIVWGIGVSAVVAFIGFKLVGGAMHRNHLIKG